MRSVFLVLTTLILRDMMYNVKEGIRWTFS